MLGLIEAVTTADGFRPLSDQKWVHLSGAAADAAAELAAASRAAAHPTPTPAAATSATPAPGGGAARGDGAARGGGAEGGDGARVPDRGGRDTDRTARRGGPLALLAWIPASGRAEGPPVGYGQLQSGDGTWTVEVAVHPDHRDPQGTIETLLIKTALAVVADLGGSALRVWMAAPPPEREAVAHRLGFTLERELRQLRVPLPLADTVRAAAVPVAVRPFRPGADEAAWLNANNRAFAGHPEQGAWTLGDLAARRREPWFDASGFLLHEEAGRLAAFCWTKVHRETRPPVGEIYVIAVDPDFQGRGLGRALAVAGLEHLTAVGLTEGMLFVDGANTSALALYASLGFAPARVDRAYLRPVDGRGGAPERRQTPETPTARPIP